MDTPADTSPNPPSAIDGLKAAADDDHARIGAIRQELQQIETAIAGISLLDISALESEAARLSHERLGVIADISLGTKTQDDLVAIEEKIASVDAELREANQEKARQQDLLRGLEKRRGEKVEALHAQIDRHKSSRREYLRARVDQAAEAYAASFIRMMGDLIELQGLMREYRPTEPLTGIIREFPFYAGVSALEDARKFQIPGLFSKLFKI